MRVEVTILPEARHDLLTLLAPRTQSESDAIHFGYTYLEDLDRQFQRFDGIPPGSRRVRGADGSERWWRYVNGIWVVYRIADRSRWLFGGLIRTVTITAFESAAPAP
jgi:hypothetical protein